MGLPFHPQPKPASRLVDKTAKRREDQKQLMNLRREVWRRDGKHCRICHCLVVHTPEALQRRGDVHHLKPRAHKLTRYDPDNCILICAACHQKLTRHEIQWP